MGLVLAPLLSGITGQLHEYVARFFAFFFEFVVHYAGACADRKGQMQMITQRFRRFWSFWCGFNRLARPV